MSVKLQRKDRHICFLFLEWFSLEAHKSTLITQTYQGGGESKHGFNGKNKNQKINVKAASKSSTLFNHSHYSNQGLLAV